MYIRLLHVLRKWYILLPHSLGGAYATYWVSKYPEEIEGIVFLDGTQLSDNTELSEGSVIENRLAIAANQMGLTPKYLSEIISSTSKRTPNDWIDKYVTTEIRNQLSNTNKKISEIADDLNFPSQSFLGKYFRENVGMSPSEYRKRN